MITYNQIILFSGFFIALLSGLVIIDLPLFIVVAFAVLLLILNISLYINGRIRKDYLITFTLLLFVILLDNYNDFQYTRSLRGPMLSAIYSVLFVLFALLVPTEKARYLWKGLVLGSLVVIPILTYVDSQLNIIGFYVFIVAVYYYHRTGSIIPLLLGAAYNLRVIEARAAVLGLAIYLFMIVFNSPRRNWNQGLLVLGALLLVIVSTLSVIYYESVIVGGRSDLFRWRGIMWLYYLDYFIHHDLFFGSSQLGRDVYFYDISSRYIRDFMLRRSTHNGFISMLFQTGIVGFTAILLFFSRTLTQRIGYAINNVNMFIPLLIMYSFTRGSSFYGFSIDGILILFAVTMPLETWRKPRLLRAHET